MEERVEGGQGRQVCGLVGGLWLGLGSVCLCGELCISLEWGALEVFCAEQGQVQSPLMKIAWQPRGGGPGGVRAEPRR